MKPVRILAGVLPEFEPVLRRTVETQADLALVACVADGGQLLAAAQRLAPDVIITELTLPVLDGLGVLKQLADLDLPQRPRVLMIAPVVSETLLQALLAAGADYIMLKPVDAELLGGRIRQLAHSGWALEPPLSQPRPQAAAAKAAARTQTALIAQMLGAIGLSRRVSGYQYLHRAVELVADDVRLLAAMTKRLYPLLAKEYNSTPPRVERSIRYAIAATWRKGDQVRLKALLGGGYTAKPTNSEVIAVLADRIRCGHVE